MTDKNPSSPEGKAKNPLARHLEQAGHDDFDAHTNHSLQEEDLGKTVSFGKHTIAVSDLIKAGGLLLFFCLLGGICVAVWPTISDIFQEGGIDLLIQRMQEAGAAGVFILFGLQILQVVVAFIPGEVTQVAAGMLYGPWFGVLIVLIGAMLASAIVYLLVHSLGAPFVHAMVSDSFLDKFREFERSGKLNVIVFVLFLIPGLPKDVFTYLVALTDMKMGTFLALSTIGRAPGALVSTYAASSLVSGDVLTGVIIFVVAAAVAIVGVIFRDRIMDFFSRKRS